MSGLPQGALEQLLSPEGGQAAFDKAIADSQAQTLAATQIAKNAWNESKLARQSDDEFRAIRESHVLKGMRENPGRTRAEIEAAFDAEAKAAREKWDEAQAKRQADNAPLRGKMFDTSQMAPEDVIALAGIERPVMPSQFEFDNDVLGAFAGFALEENIPTPTANDLVTWWSDVVLGAAGGDINWDEAERVFNATFSDLTDRQRAALAAWMRQIHGVGDGQEEDEGA
jgi:hypothetical protein